MFIYSVDRAHAFHGFRWKMFAISIIRDLVLWEIYSPVCIIITSDVNCLNMPSPKVKIYCAATRMCRVKTPWFISISINASHIRINVIVILSFPSESKNAANYADLRYTWQEIYFAQESDVIMNTELNLYYKTNKRSMFVSLFVDFLNFTILGQYNGVKNHNNRIMYVYRTECSSLDHAPQQWEFRNSI